MFDETLIALKEIQKTHDLESFFGWKEGQFFEAKESRGYNLEEQKDRVELTKDVSAFANSQSGILIVGLVTEKPNLQEKIDVVTKLDLIVLSAFQKEKLEGIIRDNIQGKLQTCKLIPLKAKTRVCLF